MRSIFQYNKTGFIPGSDSPKKASHEVLRELRMLPWLIIEFSRHVLESNILSWLGQEKCGDFLYIGIQSEASLNRRVFFSGKN